MRVQTSSLLFLIILFSATSSFNIFDQNTLSSEINQLTYFSELVSDLPINTTEGWITINITPNNTEISNILYNATIPLPGVPVDVTGGGTITLKNLTCTNLVFSNLLIQVLIKNSLIEPNVTADFSSFEGLYVNVTLSDSTLNCTSEFHYEKQIGKPEDGIMNFTLIKTDIVANLHFFLTNSTGDSSNSTTLLTEYFYQQFKAQKMKFKKNSVQNNFLLNNDNFEIANNFHNSEIPVLSNLLDFFVQSDNYYQYHKQNNLVMKEESNGLRDSPRVYDYEQYNDVLNTKVSYFNSTSESLNSAEQIVKSTMEKSAIPLVINETVVIVASNVTQLFNVISEKIFNVTMTWENYDFPRPLDVEGFIYGLILSTVLSILSVGYFSITEFLQYKKRKQSENKNSSFNYDYLSEDEYQKNYQKEHPNESMPLYKGSSDAEKVKEYEFRTSPSMMRSEKIHWIWRYFILLFFLYNIAIFISATISVAASVYIYIQLPSITYQTPSLYSFTLVSSVIEMWEAGIWPLALLIGVASGIWPYIKLILLIFCWVTPITTKYFTSNARGVMIIVLDALGKWSLIDAYVLVLFLESFRVHLQFTEHVKLDMVVIPQYAFYAYLVGLIMSLSITHFVLYFHKKIVEPPIPVTIRESLYSHSYKIKNHSHKREDNTPNQTSGATSSISNFLNQFSSPFVASFTTTGKVAILLLLVFTILLTIIGYFTKAFEFNYTNSLVGYLLPSNINSYSIASLTYQLPETTLDNPWDVGIRIIQATFLLFSFLIPMLFIVSLIFLWVCPMTSREQHNFFVWVEIVSAWAAVDVFIVALIVALFELEQFAIFVVDGRCDSLDVLLDAILTFTGNANDQTTCFTVKATLSWGSLLLLIAVLMLDVVGYTIMIMCRRAIYERMHREIAKQSQPNLLSNDYQTVDDTYSISSHKKEYINKSTCHVRVCHKLSCIDIHPL